MDSDPKRQIEFPPMQTHSKTFETVMVVLSIACAVIVLAILLLTDMGTAFRPTV